MLVLFFDTYISAGYGDKGGSTYRDDCIMSTLAKVRDGSYAYRWQHKIDVVKYTLASYSKIKWDKVVIRFECEDPSQISSFTAYCRELFQTADIVNERSATAAQYFDALTALNERDDTWIFFSPNNDHPYLAEPGDLNRFVSIADKVSTDHPDQAVSLLFSHFTESMLDNRITDPQWGYFGFKFKKVIYEDADVVVTTSNIAPLDSIQVFKLGYLKQLFSATKNTGRVIRLEDTEFCSSPDHNLIQVSPKIELCRHYDSYSHLMNYVPPLFIPDGFFEKEIKIRYGYNNAIKGWVNVNPLKESIGLEVDLLNLQDDIPCFWKDRLSAFDKNPLFPQDIKKEDLAYYKNIQNPWRDRPVFINVIRSCYIFIILQGLNITRRFIRIILIRLGLFPSARFLKRLFLPDNF